MTMDPIAFLAAIALAIASPAWADDEKPSGAVDLWGIETVTVTAEEQRERLQDVPASVSVIGGDSRIGVEGASPLPFTWRLDGWMRNAVDEEYVPLAFPFPLAPSGYVGESGAPRTFGFTPSIGL
jgi:hypothetical protein